MSYRSLALFLNNSSDALRSPYLEGKQGGKLNNLDCLQLRLFVHIIVYESIKVCLKLNKTLLFTFWKVFLEYYACDNMPIAKSNNDRTKSGCVSQVNNW